MEKHPNWMVEILKKKSYSEFIDSRIEWINERSEFIQDGKYVFERSSMILSKMKQYSEVFPTIVLGMITNGGVSIEIRGEKGNLYMSIFNSDEEELEIEYEGIFLEVVNYDIIEEIEKLF